MLDLDGFGVCAFSAFASTFVILLGIIRIENFIQTMSLHLIPFAIFEAFFIRVFQAVSIQTKLFTSQNAQCLPIFGIITMKYFTTVCHNYRIAMLVLFKCYYPISVFLSTLSIKQAKFLQAADC